MGYSEHESRELDREWNRRQERLDLIAEKMRRPNWGRRVSGVIRRVVKSDCHFCGRPDFIHHISCKRARSSWGQTRIAYGNAVIRAAERVKAWRALGELKANLSTHIETHGLVFVDGVWVEPS